MLQEKKLTRKPLFNEKGDTEIDKRKMVGGNTTNLNDFNNLKYTWVSDWYRQSMNNFWIPEEINLQSDIKEYRQLTVDERNAYDKILSFLIFLDSIQTANIPALGEFITANEINLCLTIHAFQEAVHSQSYSYMLDTICSPEERTDILYQWRDDEKLLSRNKYIGDLYNEFQQDPSPLNLVRTVVANYVLEGIYFFSGFMFFYNLGRNGKMGGSVQEIRYINRDENTHLLLFRSIPKELKEEIPELFDKEHKEMYRQMIKEGVEQEIDWGCYVIGDKISGLTTGMIKSYIRYLGNLRCMGLGLEPLYEGGVKEPEEMQWISQFSDPNLIKTDFFEAKPTAYSKSTALKDDL